jgi:hypothetical protein
VLSARKTASEINPKKLHPIETSIKTFGKKKNVKLRVYNRKKKKTNKQMRMRKLGSQRKPLRKIRDSRSDTGKVKWV